MNTFSPLSFCRLLCRFLIYLNLNFMMETWVYFLCVPFFKITLRHAILIPNLHKQMIIKSILYMAKNSLQGWDQSRPCTWKDFKSPKQRSLELFVSGTDISKGKMKRTSQEMQLIVSSGHFQRLLCRLQKTEGAAEMPPHVLSIA